ncbi:MAG TPA: hypothetical protein DD827_08310, partial [Gammaproteobacteria bacterium]|nr:hypothetical protein [Gammaproteobacteria bacterium]
MTMKTLNTTMTLAATALAGSLAFSGAASADANPFGLTDLSSGYQVAMEGKCGEGKCGGDKAKAEGKCGEGKCGG